MIESQAAPRSTLIKAIRLLLLLAISLGLGAIIATTLTSPDWTLIITAVGVGFYVTVVLVNPLLGFLLWIATAPFARFFYHFHRFVQLPATITFTRTKNIAGNTGRVNPDKYFIIGFP